MVGNVPIVLVACLLTRAAVADGLQMRELFGRAVATSGKEYHGVRQELLGRSRKELRVLLVQKSGEQEQDLLHRAAARVLLERIQKEEATHSFLTFDLFAAMKVEHKATWRYPLWWKSRENWAKKLRDQYESAPCPYTVLEALWKFGETPELRVGGNTDRGRVDSNAEYAFGFLGRELSPGERKLFVAVFEDKLLKGAHSKSDRFCFDALVFLRSRSSVPAMLKWIGTKPLVDEKQMPTSRLAQVFAYVLPLASKDHVPLLRGYRKGRQWREGNGDAAKELGPYYDEYVSMLARGKKPGKGWVEKWFFVAGHLVYFQTSRYSCLTELLAEMDPGLPKRVRIERRRPGALPEMVWVEDK